MIFITKNTYKGVVYPFCAYVLNLIKMQTVAQVVAYIEENLKLKPHRPAVGFFYLKLWAAVSSSEINESESSERRRTVRKRKPSV